MSNDSTPISPNIYINRICMFVSRVPKTNKLNMAGMKR